MLSSGHCVLPSAAILQPHFLSSVGPSPAGRSELSTLPFRRPMDKLEACESWAFWSSGPRCLQPQFPWGTKREPLLHLLAALEGVFTTPPPGSLEDHSHSQIHYHTLLTPNHFLISQSLPPRSQTSGRQIAMSSVSSSPLPPPSLYFPSLPPLSITH